MQFKDFWRPVRVNLDTPCKYLARNASEIVSKYLDRMKDKKSMAPSAFSKLSDYIKLQLTLRQIY